MMSKWKKLLIFLGVLFSLHFMPTEWFFVFRACAQKNENQMGIKSKGRSAPPLPHKHNMVEANSNRGTDESAEEEDVTGDPECTKTYKRILKLNKLEWSEAVAAEIRELQINLNYQRFKHGYFDLETNVEKPMLEGRADERIDALRFLEKIGPETLLAYHWIKKALEDKNDIVSSEAARILREFGLERYRALTPVIRLLRGNDSITKDVNIHGKDMPSTTRDIPLSIKEKRDVEWAARDAVGRYRVSSNETCVASADLCRLLEFDYAGGYIAFRMDRYAMSGSGETCFYIYRVAKGSSPTLAFQLQKDLPFVRMKRMPWRNKFLLVIYNAGLEGEIYLLDKGTFTKVFRYECHDGEWQAPSSYEQNIFLLDNVPQVYRLNQYPRCIPNDKKLLRDIRPSRTPLEWDKSKRTFNLGKSVLLTRFIDMDMFQYEGKNYVFKVESLGECESISIEK